MTPALESLRRKAAAVVTLPARRDHVAYLDGWRGVCIAFVLIGHLIPAVAPLATVGVEMFFVLSGRLMAEILIFKRQPVRIFLKRRVARIIPAAATFVVLTAAIMNATWWLAGRPLNWISPLGALFFFHNYIPPAAVAPAFDHMWSLAVEEHSYLALALIALLTSRKSPRIAMAAAIGLSAVALLNGLRLSLVAQGDGPLYLWRSDVRSASVLMSFAMCIALRPLIERPSRSLAWLTPVGALVEIAFVYRYGMSNVAGLAAGSLAGALAVNMLEQAPVAMRRHLSNAVLVWPAPSHSRSTCGSSYSSSTGVSSRGAFSASSQPRRSRCGASSASNIPRANISIGDGKSSPGRERLRLEAGRSSLAAPALLRAAFTIFR